MHFLFPADPFQPRLPDPSFAEQIEALTAAGFTTSLVPDRVIEEGGTLRGVPADAEVVYRGWMLRPDAYERLHAAVQESGARLLTSPVAYLAAHHLPNWYPLLRDLTPETRVFPENADLVQKLSALGWEAFFVKDYVKSLKTSIGSIIHEPEAILKVLEEMRRVRGEIEGGICVRRVEELLPDTERRYFVLFGVPYAADADREIPPPVRICAERVRSPFFSVDVALRRDSELRVVEIGDGQVSDLVGWSPERFARIWSEALRQHASVRRAGRPDIGRDRRSERTESRPAPQ